MNEKIGPSGRTGREAVALAAAVRRTYEGRLKQSELATKLGTTQTTISRWARGEAVPNLVDLVRMEDACGRPRGYILRSAGLVAYAVTVEDAIDADPLLPDALREPLKSAYRAMVAGALDETRGRSQ